MRSILLLALAVAGLFAATRALERPEATPAEAFVPLVDPASAATMQIAGLSVEYAATGERFLYVLRGGVWRCVGAHDALALDNPIEELAGELLGAIGEPRSEDPARAAAYGLGDDERLVVRFHGPRLGEDPAGDVLASFDLGSSLPGAGGGRSWVRPTGTDDVYEIQHDPRARLTREGDGSLPPLLDERLLAGEWPPRGGGLERAFLDYADGRSLQLTSEVREAPGLPREEWPREWTASTQDARARCLPYRIAAWQAFLYRAPYVGFSDPAAAARRGLAEPRATVTLLQVGADPITLKVGQPAPSGATFVLNEKTGQLCFLEPEVAALLLPGIGQLCEPEGGNPWESWLPR